MVHVSGTPGASDAVQSLLQEGGLQPGDASVHIIDGEPGHAISALSDKIGADVIVLGPHRKQPKGERGGPFGSTAMEAVTSASAPCLVLAQPLRLPLRCVVVGVDLSDTSRGAVVIGLAWASALRAQARAPTPATKLIALYIQPEESDGSPAPRALDEELKQMKRAAGEWAIVAIEGATATNASAAVGIIENTASAFQAAIAGNYAIECDVQISADGEAMVHHDEALGRLTDGSGRLADMSAAAIKAVPFKSTSDRIMTLGEL